MNQEKVMNIDATSEMDCAVCLQRIHHPTKLPCGHIFCFLCVKGIAIRSKKCAMCRAIIPGDYFKNPILLENQSDTPTAPLDEHGYQWYYEGRNGWWKYDERSNKALEESYIAGDSQCSLLLAGFIYDIDFTSMLQMRQDDHHRRRNVRRDTPLLPAKGIAGIKVDNGIDPPKNSSGLPDVDQDNTEEVIEILDEPQIENRDNLDAIVNGLSALNLTEETGQISQV